MKRLLPMLLLASPAVAQNSEPPPQTVTVPPGILVERGADTMVAGELGAIRVFTEGGEEVGDVETTIINHDGTVAGLVVGVGGLLGLDEKLVGVTYDHLRVRKTENGFEFVTDLTRAQLDAAPDYRTRGD